MKIIINTIMISLLLTAFAGIKKNPNEQTDTKNFDFEVEERVFTSKEVSGMTAGDKIVITKAADVSQRDPYYHLKGREYTGIPAVTITGNRIWAVWQTGGDTEPHPKNYLILAFSDDYGETWGDSFYTFEGFVTSNGAYTEQNIGTPLLHTDSNGWLWLFFGFHGPKYAVIIKNPTAEPKDIDYQAPVIIFTGASAASGLTVMKTEDGKEEWYFGTDLGYATETTVYYTNSNDKTKGWKPKGSAHTLIESGNYTNRFHEAMIVEKNDGTFWMLKRLEKGYMGGMEQSFSTDRGKTWTDYESNLGVPFIGPGSKFYFGKLSTGHLLLVTHDTTQNRSRIAAYLSVDDGKTWPYKLMIDERFETSYPDCKESDGVIYCIYDRGRVIQQEIRIAMFTEEDIIAGEFKSEKARQKVCITKRYNLRDIKSIENTDYQSEITVENGTSEEDVIKLLPASLTVKDDEGSTTTLTGVWKPSIYVKTKPGKYTFKFEPNNMSENLQDTYNLMSVTVTIKEAQESPEPKGGCKSSVGLDFLGFLGLFTFLPITFIKKHKGEKDEKNINRIK